MNYQPDKIGGGYLETAVRIERRPGIPPYYPTREEMLRLIEFVEASGAQAWWYSCAGKGSYPLFPSKYLPSVPQAEAGLFEWFTEQCHSRDIVIFSWEYLSTSPLTTREHPDWCMQFLQPIEGAYGGRIDRHLEVYGNQNPAPCFNSPYGELLMDYCVEVIEELGFDGIWFDGCFMGPANTWPGGRIGCCCPRCQKQFKDETGLDLPIFEDWSDPVFRRFIQWRQQFFADYWHRLCQHVRARSKTGLIGLNNFQRWPHSTGIGCPLNEVNFDGLSCAEISQQPWQAFLMMKYLRAVSNIHTPELWMQHNPYGPNGEPDHMIYFGELCMTAGGFHAEGQPVNPGDNIPTLRAMVDELSPRIPYVGGEPPRFAGIVLSSNTKDFAFAGDDKPTWRSVHGLHNLLMHAHWPSEIILDNQVRLDYLKTFPLVILSDVRCLSDEQARALEDYVKQGGLLLVTAQSGTMDDIGQPREPGVLDDLIGITTRYADRLPPMEVVPNGDWARDLPAYFRFWPAGRYATEDYRSDDLWAEFADDVEVLAWGAECDDDAGQSLTTSQEDPQAAPHALVTRQVGEGRVIYINRDIGGFYSATPYREYRETVIALLSAYTVPPYAVDALPHVVVTVWKQEDGRLFIHVLSQPQNLRSVAPAPHVDIGTVPPTGPVTITLPFAVKQATRPVTGAPVELKVADGSSTICIENVDRHDVIVVK